MATHELKYFNARGRAEAIRFCLYVAKGDDWTDTRFPGKDWMTVKPTTPLGSIPTLKIDGVDHCQSTALLRYTGKLAGWYPSDPLAALAVDEAVESINELQTKLPPKGQKTDEEFKQAREAFQSTVMARYAVFLEGMIQRNGGPGLAKEPSTADVLLHVLLQDVQSGNYDHLNPKFFEGYPGITATAAAMEENEQFKKYLATRK